MAHSNLQADSLSGYRWHKRVILICIPKQDAKSVKATTEVLASQRAGLAERDLILVDLSPQFANLEGVARPPAAEISRLRKLFRLGENLEFILLGKDGGEKSRQREALDLGKFFALIDKMPMRRQEMLGEN